jgi:hypothetical protein
MTDSGRRIPAWVAEELTGPPPFLDERAGNDLAYGFMDLGVATNSA